MGQSEYAQNFIKVMLGWIRHLASSVAGTFHSASGSFSSSSGMSAVNWFAENWLKLLIVLIVIGIVVDWVVWMLRWRPYWAWFRKRRILLDDDIDETMSEEELRKRYQVHVRRKEDPSPRFHSKALRRRDSEDGMLDEEDLDDAFFPDAEDEDESLSYVDIPDETDREKPDDSGERFGVWAGEDPLPQEMEVNELPFDDPDVSDPSEAGEGKKGVVGRILPIRLEKVQDDDPFKADGLEFSDLDDDFYEVVAEEPDHPIRHMHSGLKKDQDSGGADEEEDDVFGGSEEKKEPAGKRARRHGKG